MTDYNSNDTENPRRYKTINTDFDRSTQNRISHITGRRMPASSHQSAHKSARGNAGDLQRWVEYYPGVIGEVSPLQ